MNYYANKRRKTLAVLDLLPHFFVLSVLVSALIWSCGQAIDKDQEHHELAPAERQAVVATWKK